MDEFSNVSLVTTDATNTALWSWEIPEGCTLWVAGVMSARAKAGGTVMATIDSCGSRNVGGAAAVNSYEILLFNNAASATWNAFTVASGNNFVITVTGQAATTIAWSLKGGLHLFNENLF